MTNTAMPHKKIHQGRNIKRFREMLGIKQEALAFELGEDWNQKKISMLEQKDVIENSLLKQISAVLKIPAEAIENFDEEQAIVNIQNNYEGANSGNGNLSNGANNPTSYVDCSFNPIDKIVALYDEKIALHERMLDEKITLYERMLKDKEEMMSRLEKLL
jgi:transcriptional regulator with XRE-family HTH domain